MERETKQAHELLADALVEQKVSLDDDFGIILTAQEIGLGDTHAAEIWRAVDLARRISQAADATRGERL